MASLGSTLLPLSLTRSRSDPSPSFSFGLHFSFALRKALEGECLARCPRRRLSSRVRAVVTQGIPVARTAKAERREKINGEQDEISILHEKIRQASSGKRDGPQTKMASAEADKYIQMVKMQQQRGLRMLKGEKDGADEAFSYKADPYSLRPGDYVVHKKVGIGRFVGTRFDVRKGSTEPVECVFIEYADGMAKLPVKQAARMLYRYSL